MMNDEQLKNQLNHIINECEGIAQWVGEVNKAMGRDMYLPLESRLDSLYEEAMNMSSIAVKTRLTIATHSGKFDNEKDKEDEE